MALDIEANRKRLISNFSGVLYGDVYAYMKRPIEDRHLTDDAIVEVAPKVNIPSIEVRM